MTQQKHQEMSKYQLKKLIKKLDDIRGRNTELVSVYIPAGYDMAKMGDFITSEASEAENIKSKHTRKNVQAALDKIGRKLKEEQQTPENGVAFFAGNVSEREGRPDIQVWEVIPPQPIESRHYRCDKEFVLEPLKQMIVDDKVYGLVVADKNEAAIGFLQGNSVKTVQTMSSNVPGKTKAGGQCLDPDTIVQMSNGELRRIDDVEVGDCVKSADFVEMRIKDSEVIDKWENEKELYKIETKHPKKIIKASADHELFRTDRGVESVAVKNLEEGDKLIFPESIQTSEQEELLMSQDCYNSFIISNSGRHKLKQRRKEKSLSQKKLSRRIDATQASISKIELGERNAGQEFLRNICNELGLDFMDFTAKYCIGKNYKLPKSMDRDLAEILGYFIGDGSFDSERLNFHESDREVAEKYQEKLESVFGCDTSIRFREDKNYYLLRAFGKPLVKFVKKHFPEIKKSRTTQIPAKILRDDEEVLKGFITGFYDAEGSCSENRKRISISTNNEVLMHQLQSSLLRIGIISSLTTYNNSKNPYSSNTKYTVSVSDQESIEKFAESIKLKAPRKQKELDAICNNKKSKNNNRQIVKNGKEVRNILEDHDYLMEDFKSANTYLQGKREISKKVFEERFVKNSKGDLNKQFRDIQNSQLLPTKIKSIEKIGNRKTIDISVESRNFIANNLVVHNSAQRFERFRKEMYQTFMREISDKAKRAFLPKKREEKLLGVIVGGPGFTKDKLIEDDYLHQEIQEKIVAKESTNYSGEEALEELVAKAEDAIEDSQVIKEKNLVKEFFENLKKENGKSEYGPEQVKKALDMGAVKTVLISESTELYYAEFESKSGEKKHIFESKAEIPENMESSSGEEMDLVELADIVDAFGKTAEEMSSELEIIGNDHEEGRRLENFGGIAAILRYRIR